MQGLLSTWTTGRGPGPILNVLFFDNEGILPPDQNQFTGRSDHKPYWPSGDAVALVAMRLYYSDWGAEMMACSPEGGKSIDVLYTILKLFFKLCEMRKSQVTYASVQLYHLYWDVAKHTAEVKKYEGRTASLKL